MDSIEAMRCAACEGSGRILEACCLCCDGVGSQQVTVKMLCPECFAQGYDEELDSDSLFPGEIEP